MELLDDVKLGYIGALGVTFGASGLRFGWALELLDCLRRSLWVPRASKIEAAGDQADIAQTCQNLSFHEFLRFGR